MFTYFIIINLFVCLFQFYGYAVLAGFSVLMFFIVGIFDCCKSGKCCIRRQGLPGTVPQGGARNDEQGVIPEKTIPLNTIDPAPNISSAIINKKISIQYL